MAILVDYRCAACGIRAEHWQPTPPPASVPCASCGAESRRLFAAVGLSGSTAAPRTAVAPTPRGSKLCSQYPQIPGLCHMSESAGRMWVGKYLKDGRAVDREQQRQEEAASITPPKLEDAITHHHVDVPPAPSTTPS